MDRILLEVRTARTGEETPEAMTQFLASFISFRRRVLYFYRKAIPLSLEIAVYNSTIHFFVSVPTKYKEFLESQLVSQYPKALLVKTPDYMSNMLVDDGTLALGQLRLAHGSLFPLKTYKDFTDVDPMSSLLATLGKLAATDAMVIQFLVIPTSGAWQSKGAAMVNDKRKDSEGVTIPNPYTKVITDKIAYNGFNTLIRIGIKSTSKAQSGQNLFTVINAFASFNNPSGNSLAYKRVFPWQRKKLIKSMIERKKPLLWSGDILNIAELATMYHFPTMAQATMHNLSWHKVILSDAPENLPVAEGLTEEEKQEINFFGRTEWKNHPANFGIKTIDRRRHMYIVGKTGTGKSTLIANMIISDIRKGRGVCVVDPHGDLCETVMDYIPSFRLNDVVYVDPSDKEFAIALNPLEATDPHQKELIVSGIVAIFQKIYMTSWGPRLEYILRNCLMSAINLPNPTLMTVPQLLTDEGFRKKAVTQLTDPVLINFWTKEFEQMHPRLRSEAVSPILNKVGQFVTSPTIRNIIKQHKSTIDIQKIMDEGKILIMNLSQGKLGEDNAALLGAMVITKIQLAAMNRVDKVEENRRDFYLYVDEFQNFATTSFIKILSEARKYHLNLIMANQYIGQIPEEVRLAIFGNTGTMMSFLVGAEDSTYLAKEFAERFKEEDMLALGNFQAILKLCIDGRTSSPFLCQTLPLPNSRTQNREKAIRNSRERYTRKVSE